MAGLQKERKNIIKTVHDLLFVQKEPVLAEYLLLFLVFLVPFVTMMYGDTKAFVHYGVNFWKSITEGGGLHNFYDYSNGMLAYYRENGIGGAYEVIYEDFQYGLFAADLALRRHQICGSCCIQSRSILWRLRLSHI